MDDDSVRVITGPTAAGKSALAMALAGRSNATIISADSRQIYRGFDIGTAKPTPEERGMVPHRGIDLIEGTERYSAARWAGAARSWIAEAHAAGRTPVVVGGTGFYIRALAEPLFGEPEVDQGRRGAVARELGRLSVAELRRWCTRLDPARAHLGRTQLLRAVEIALLTGVPISAWHRRAPRAPGVRLRYLVVDPGDGLHDRIVRRVHSMLAAGWREETRALAARVPAGAPAWNATGYAAIRAHVEGSLSLEAAVSRVIIDTRQYAKRQRTWLRHQLPASGVMRLDPRTPGAADRAQAWWNDHMGGET